MRKDSVLLVVAAALVNEEGSLLLSRRPPGKMMAGMWEFPGGKVEAGETPEEALCRELFEEITIAVKEEDLSPLQFASHSYPEFHLLMPLFLIRKWEGAPIAAEGQLLKWWKMEELNPAKMPPPDGPLIERLKQELGA